MAQNFIGQQIPTNFKMFAWQFAWLFVWQNPVCVTLCVAKPGLRGDLCGTLRGLTIEGMSLNRKEMCLDELKLDKMES